MQYNATASLTRHQQKPPLFLFFALRSKEQLSRRDSTLISCHKLNKKINTTLIPVH